MDLNDVALQITLKLLDTSAIKNYVETEAHSAPGDKSIAMANKVSEIYNTIYKSVHDCYKELRK